MSSFSSYSTDGLFEDEERFDGGDVRHLIANCAHDLKTPLSSFMNGIDVIDQVVGGIESKVKIGKANNEEILSSFEEIRSYLRHITNTNHFMVAAINRFQDMAKATSGVKLKPNYETIDLEETLNLPLQCMISTHPDARIRMDLLPEEVGSHVITDKQWLQENLLCLLSNAVKYSSPGAPINVSISLEYGRGVQESDLLPCCSGDQQDNTHGPNSNSSDHSRSSNHSHHSRYNSHNSSMRSSLASSFSSAASSSYGMHHLGTMNNNSNKKISPRSAYHLFHNPTEGDHSTTANNEAEGDDHEEEEESCNLRVAVSDSGIGLSEQARSQLFRPFQQSQSLAGGTGLGLFSLAQRTRALQGECGVCARGDGQPGSVFWFSFPFRADHSLDNTKEDICNNHDDSKNSRPAETTLTDSIGSSAQNSPVDHPAPCTAAATTTTTATASSLATIGHGKKKLRILLAEDSACIARITHSLLSRFGFEVTVAANGALACDQYNRLALLCNNNDSSNNNSSGNGVDVILMDLQMPVMDGMEATRRIRQLEAALLHDDHHSRRARVPVIGLSANNDRDTLKEAMAAGCDAFMDKPFKMEVFEAILQQLLPRYDNNHNSENQSSETDDHHQQQGGREEQH